MRVALEVGLQKLRVRLLADAARKEEVREQLVVQLLPYPIGFHLRKYILKRMEQCIFCNIIAGEIPAERTYEDEDFIAFLDIHPKAPGHTLLIPKEHHQWFIDMPEPLYGRLFSRAKDIAQTLRTERGADYVHLSIVGTDVPHVHVHLIPRKLSEKADGAM